MIEFYSENDFELENSQSVSGWVTSIIESEGFEEGEITFVFCTDVYLHNINLEFLSHDTFTDIVSFNYSLGRELHGEIYISTERVTENAARYGVDFEDELHRVIIHGILHFCGYNDTQQDETVLMRTKENESLDARSFM